MHGENQVKGETHTVEVDGDTPLLWVVRDYLGMTGTKFGCGIGQCGACTVHLNGRAVRSCLVSFESAINTRITTIEGLSRNASHPLQRVGRGGGGPRGGGGRAGGGGAAAAGGRGQS